MPNPPAVTSPSLAVACPICRAEANTFCTQPSGGYRAVHLQRIWRFQRCRAQQERKEQGMK